MTDGNRRFPFMLYAPGAAVLAAGILILVFPRLLALLVASLLLCAGFAMLVIADGMRRSGHTAGGMRRVITVMRSRGPSGFGS